MSSNLLVNMFYAAPELWYVIWLLFAILIALLFYSVIHILKLNQKNYFLNRDRERFAETLYAAKDGYFSFIYPDTKINDPRKGIKESCSRRLAVMLNLPNGTQSSFDDVLKCFYKDDALKLQKYVGLLQNNGVAFEDMFSIKNGGRVLRLSGARISDAAGNLYCDMVWFRDVSNESTQIDELEAERQKVLEKNRLLNDLFDNLPYPVWLRDENLYLKLVNRKYLDFINTPKDKDAVVREGIEICTSNNESISKDLAQAAHASIKQKRQKVALVRNGERRSFDVTEVPFRAEQTLDKVYSVGSMTDITELDELKRNLKQHQNSHLEILGALGTAFAVFDAKKKLAFYNKAFAKMWELDTAWLEKQPSYVMFLDEIREKRLLPEVPDFVHYKDEEIKDFNKIIEAKEDLLHLPDGRTFRRVRAQYPMGGLLFAFEDVTDRLATRRAYNDLVSTQKEILDNLSAGIAIFAANGRLRLYNKEFANLWKCKEIFLQNEPSIPELVESCRAFFSHVADWEQLRSDIVNHITNSTTKSFSLVRNDHSEIEVVSAELSDGSLMVTCRPNLD